MEQQGSEGGDADLVAIKPTSAAKVGAAFMAGAGVLGLVIALQGAVVLALRGAYQLSELVFGGLGALGVFAGARLASMRSQGAWLTVVIGAALALSGLVWFALALRGGVFILLAIVLVPIAGVAAGLGGANLAATRRADEARARLRAQGLDAGF